MSSEVLSDEVSAAPKVTVIAACLNEAIQLDQWLDHLDWVDDIIVVDAGSRDGSIDRLQSRGVRLLQGRDGSATLIHALKNQGVAEVQEGWILDLDVDERVPLPLVAEIRERIVDAPVETSAFRLPFRHYIFGRWVEHGGWDSRHIRLYRAGTLRYPEDRAHSTPQVQGEIADLVQSVVHFAHPTLHDFWVKMNRYTSQDAPLSKAHGRGGIRNRAPLPPRRLSWLRASASVFWNRYVKASGFRDGIPGFLVAVLMAAYTFVEQAKIWELEQPTDSVNPA